MLAYEVKTADLRLVVGPDSGPIPTGYWISANHTDAKRNPVGVAVTSGRIFGAGDQANPVLVIWRTGIAGILDAWDVNTVSKARLAVEGTKRLLRGGSLDNGIGPKVDPDKPADRQPRSAIGILGGSDKVIHVYLENASLRGLALTMKALGCRDAIQLSFSDRTTAHEKGVTKAGTFPVVSLMGADTYTPLIKGPIVLWDPGHGGEDPGASGPYLSGTEAFYNLQYTMHGALHMRKTYPGCTVLLTRFSDETISLEDRAEMANAMGASVFVSCHNNAAGGRGFETFSDPYPESENPGRIEESRKLQKCVHLACVDKIVKPYGMRDRGMKQEDFYVLRKPDMPSVLIEGAFMDHPDDAKLIGNSKWLHSLGVAVAEGVAIYLGLTPLEQPTEPPKSGYVVEVEAASLEEAEAIRRVLSERFTVRIVSK